MQSQHVSQRPQVSSVVFTGLLGRAVRTLVPHSEADPVGILAALLSVFSAAIDNGPRVHYGTQIQTLSVWTVLIGNTGQGRKGTATRAALDIARTALPDWAKATILEGCPQSGPAYVSTLAEMNGTALMLEEEFADLLKVSARYKSMGKALRRSWEGASISNRTKEAVIQVDAPHVSIIGNITPTEWATSIGKADRAGGTLNRFLPLYVERSKKIKLSEQISADDWAALIRPLAREFRLAVTFARNIEEVTVSRAALALWDDKLSDLIDGLSIGREAMEQFAARASDYVWRVSALYALADQREEIVPTDLEAAVGLVTYVCDTVTYLTPELSGGQSQESLARKIEQFVKGAGEEGCTATEIYRAFSIKASDLRDIVAELETIEVTKSQAGRGRPTMIYRYVAPEASEVASEEIEEINEVETATPVEIPSVDVMADADFWSEESDADFWGETPEEAAIKAALIEASADVPSAVRDLRVILEGVEPGQAPETVTVASEAPKPSQALTGVAALAALLESVSAPVSAPEVPVTEESPVTLTIVPEAPKVGPVGTKAVPVPPVIFQAPSVEYVSAA
ncbi:hypothetical protein AB0C14_22690 [Microbispora hainanensis]|uniref:hypothetical protein n=1 Tax=Microbispora hainanensis TaxID=568844 RepID=UPI0033E4CB82